MTEAKERLQELAAEACGLVETIQQYVEEEDYNEGVHPLPPSHELCRIAPRLAAALEEASMEEDDEGEVGEEMVELPAVVQAPLSKKYHYITHHKPAGKGLELYGYRVDVTEPMKALIVREIADYMKYLQETYGLDMSGVVEKSGKPYVHELVEEWRASK